MLNAAQVVSARWRGRERYVVLDADFGMGHAFLDIWQAWRTDPQRCSWLTVVAVVAEPPTRTELASTHGGSNAPMVEWLRAWPPLTPDLHALDFDGGRVRLLLAIGDLRSRLPDLRMQADAIYVPASVFSPGADVRSVEVFGRKSARGAMLLARVAAADRVRAHAALNRAGFVIRAQDDDSVLADHAPRTAPQRLPDAAVAGRDAVVVGAGIAGAAAAHALARSGFAVTVLDRQAEPTGEASGNPAGLFHGVVHAGDGLHARLYRAASLQAQRIYGAAVSMDDSLGLGAVPGSTSGLLRTVSPPSTLQTMQSVLARSGLTADHVQALDAKAASRMAGVPLQRPAWFYPGGGWIDPRAWVRHALGQRGVCFVGGADVAAVANDGDGWCLKDRQGELIARAAAVVLAQGASTGQRAMTSAMTLAPMHWPLARSRGQISYWSGSRRERTPLRMALAGDGYALPLPDGGLVCGATNIADTGSDDVLAAAPSLAQADHQHNLQRLHRLTGLQPPTGALMQGRTGWRVQAADRLPIAGALPLAELPLRRDQARLLPRARGLFVMTALGSRGLTLAPLLAELIAAQACGDPWPLPQDLADAVDPARWIVRAARRG